MSYLCRKNAGFCDNRSMVVLQGMHYAIGGGVRGAGCTVPVIPPKNALL